MARIRFAPAMEAEGPPLRLRLLRAALEDRLREVQARIGGGSRRTPEVPSPAFDDVEETLRVLMVRLWPRLGATAGADELTLVCEHLRALSRPARSADLRFLDAWNNAYEALGAQAPDHVLAEYSEILAAQIRRLGLT